MEKNETKRIQTLNSEVVDQIAAGEVVERPAHMVKELVENSLDAGATEIHVEFSDGGRSVIVTDNGSGIHPEDLKKALDRHATSKIHLSEDLWKLKTFGFRGEALASIAAVSRLSLSSKVSNQKKGYQIQSDFGKASDPDQVGHSQGTRIQIEDLFENIPARLKFLKSASAESSQIKTVLKALALANPQVEFKVTQDQSLIYFWSAVSSKLERVRQILEIENLYEGTAERDSVKAYAVFGDPNTTAKTSKNIWLFAQGRWIQDRGLQAAVMDAYRNLLMHGEYPIAAVWVETDPEQIDVNIHPTKSQVKFLDPSLAFRAVAASLRETLEKAPWIQTMAAKSLETSAKPEVPAPTYQNYAFQDRELSRSQYQQKEMPSLNQIKMAAQDRPEIISEAPISGFFSQLQVLGQAHLTYILAQSRDGLMIIDQHAAHERVMFEKLMGQWTGGKIEIQEYLFPIAVDLSPDKIEGLEKYIPDFQKLELGIEALGPTTLGVKSAPSLIKESIIPSVLETVAQQILDRGGSFQFEKMIGDICARLACHSAIRAGQALSIPEMQALLKSMDEYPLSSFCPHGRPVYIEYPLYKLEKDFGRIV
ncbi:MAG: DNA mismatch repair protein MutL [Oligoflexia bacterium]|nr:MAG: DNA mismatch repair protein MutL [Oligoflexia bacterium]